MPLPIIKNWKIYFEDPDEGLGSSYERIVLNNKLEKFCRHFKVNNILEAPSFGFTGISGINSLYLAQKGYQVSLLDHNEERLSLINSVWKKIGFHLDSRFVTNYEKLPFPDKSFDLSWNFASIWFAENLDLFLKELARVTKKIIFIGVPNQAGLGFRLLKILGKEELRSKVNAENINADKIQNLLSENGWKLFDKNYIDVPPWPDIGMPKADFLKIFGLKKIIKEEENESCTIMDFYSGKDPDFPNKMMKYYGLEKYAPNFIKYFWAHHKYLVFIPDGMK
ncbi:MAG: class I SAM-dependent methyltransferase [Candidatus Cloacimonetes bacterium]|nr:class I SAM-dependent methyltransferase [Candidatus Cloacimonadota bacterium]